MTGWFDELYAAGASGRVRLPWSRTEPHPRAIANIGRLVAAGGTLLVISAIHGGQPRKRLSEPDPLNRAAMPPSPPTGGGAQTGCAPDTRALASRFG